MIRLYADGACGKNGIGGWAWILTKDDRFVTVDRGSTPDATNQRMELIAAGKGLAWAPTWLELTVVSDSAYLVNCFLQRWYEKWRSNGWLTSAKKDVENRDVWEPLLAVVEAREAPTHWEHVKGHNGDRWNEHCDELAVAARKAAA